MRGKGILFLDTGADVNAVRHDSLEAETKIRTSHVLKITKISPEPLGFVFLRIFGKLIKFHILPNNSPIKEDALLGSHYFRTEGANLLFDKEMLIFPSNPNDHDPFISCKNNILTEEFDSDSSLSSSLKSDKALILETSEERSNKDSSFDCSLGAATPFRSLDIPLERTNHCKFLHNIPKRKRIRNKSLIRYRLKPRERVPVAIPVKGTLQNGDGYLPCIPTPAGAYLGEAAVTVTDCVCYTMATNTNTEPIEIKIPAQELEPFEIDESGDMFGTESSNDGVTLTDLK